jgi:hypothetical protein
MKKIFFSALVALSVASAVNATEYVVYSGGAALSDDQVKVPIGGYYSWNGDNFATADETYNGRTVQQFQYNAGTGWCGAGWTVDLSQFSPAVLYDENAELVFDAKCSEGNETSWRTKCVINVDSEHANEVVIQDQLSTEWKEVRVPLKSLAPDFYAYLNQTASSMYAFSVVGQSCKAGDILYFTNVRYVVPDATAPQLKVTANVSDVTYNSAVINYNITSKNLTDDVTVKLTTADGGTVATLDANETAYTLTGLTEKTAYTYKVVVSANDIEDSAEVSFTTKSENFEPKTWYQNYCGTITNGGVTYCINSDVAITTTEDGAVNIKAKIVGGEDLISVYKFQVLHMDNGAVAHENFMTLNKVEDTTNQYEGTTNFNGLTEGTALANMQVYYEFPGHAFMINYTGYHYGDENANTFETKPIITAYNVSDITANSATVNYTVANADEFDNVTVKLNDADLTSKELTGLTAGTTYNYTLTATATKGDQTYNSNEAALSFTTLSEDETEAVWYKQLSGTFTDATVNGVSGQDVEYNALVTLTYYAGKITAELTINEEATAILGFNPQFREKTGSYLSSTTKSRAAGEYYYELEGTYTPGTVITDFGILFAYPGSGDRGNAPEESLGNYTVGETNNNPIAGVSTVATDATEAPVEYFNLQGMRVQGDLTPGFYIRRQGQTATKVLIK